jgi:hypothetical protein
MPLNVSSKYETRAHAGDEEEERCHLSLNSLRHVVDLLATKLNVAKTPRGDATCDAFRLKRLGHFQNETGRLTPWLLLE